MVVLIAWTLSLKVIKTPVNVRLQALRKRMVSPSGLMSSSIARSTECISFVPFILTALLREILQYFTCNNLIVMLPVPRVLTGFLQG